MIYGTKKILGIKSPNMYNVSAHMNNSSNYISLMIVQRIKILAIVEKKT